MRRITNSSAGEPCRGYRVVFHERVKLAGISRAFFGYVPNSRECDWQCICPLRLHVDIRPLVQRAPGSQVTLSTLLRDRLLARLSPGHAPDYQRLACEVLGIRGAAPALARTLVEQALVFEDLREHWRRVGERARREAPAAPGVYIFRDWFGAALYVGKAANLRRRLSAHFADRRWLVLPPALARVAAIEWQQAGSEIEALLREACLIRDLQPIVNLQTAAPTLAK